MRRSRADRRTQLSRLDERCPQPGQAMGGRRAPPPCGGRSSRAMRGPRDGVWVLGGTLHGCPPAQHCSTPSTAKPSHARARLGYVWGSPTSGPSPASHKPLPAPATPPPGQAPLMPPSPPQGKPLGFAPGSFCAAILGWHRPCCAGCTALCPPRVPVVVPPQPCCLLCPHHGDSCSAAPLRLNILLLFAPCP